VFAEKDHLISRDDVHRVRNTFEDANLSYRMKVYADAPHGFLNDTMPGRYRPETTREAWAFLLDFLRDVFDGGWPHGRVLCEFSNDMSKGYDFTKNPRVA
jgi:carboxymethylenebutenolidase